MPMPNDSPSADDVPAPDAEVLCRLAQDEQEWMTMDDEAFDRLLREGDEPLAFGGV